MEICFLKFIRTRYARVHSGSLTSISTNFQKTGKTYGRTIAVYILEASKFKFASEIFLGNLSVTRREMEISQVLERGCTINCDTAEVRREVLKSEEVGDPVSNKGRNRLALWKRPGSINSQFTFVKFQYPRGIRRKATLDTFRRTA